MCVVKKPRVATTPPSPASTDKKPKTIRNLLLDGLLPIIRARASGTRAFRIDRRPAGAPQIPTPQVPSTPPAPPTIAPPQTPTVLGPPVIQPNPRPRGGGGRGKKWYDHTD